METTVLTRALPAPAGTETETTTVKTTTAESVAIARAAVETADAGTSRARDAGDIVGFSALADTASERTIGIASITPEGAVIESAVSTLAGIEPDRLTAGESLALARSVERLTRAAEAVLVRCVRTWHDRGDPVQSPTSTEEELAWRSADAARKALIVDLGRSRVEAGRLIGAAKALRRDSPTAEVLRGGGISVAQARIIADTVDLLRHLPEEAVSGARGALIGHARAGGTEELRRAAPDVAHRVAPTAVLNEARRRHARRGLTMTPTLGGYVPGGYLPAAGAEAVLTVLDSLPDDAVAGPDHRSEAQARADALVRLAEERLRGGELPQRRGGAATVTVVMRADTALGLPDAPPAVTGYGQSLPAAEAHLLACEASIRAVLVDGDGDVLWQGRGKRVATRAQHEALAVRDGGCTAPGCSRPARECDAHHNTPWSEGGRTDVAAMRLLCRRHHRELHDKLWLKQYSWQEGEVRARRESRVVGRPRKPWYVDEPAWYPGPSPWKPSGETAPTAASAP